MTILLLFVAAFWALPLLFMASLYSLALFSPVIRHWAHRHLIGQSSHVDRLAVLPRVHT